MRIEAISLTNVPPIREFSVSTSSSVVVIAGANGSGKTRLKEAIANAFRSPGASTHATLRIAATRVEEEKAWGGKGIDLVPSKPAGAFGQYMQARTRGNTYVGTAVQIDSDRAVQNLKFQAWGLATTDPDEEDVAFSYYLSPFGNRWSELMNKIHQKLASRDNKLARFVKDNSPTLTLADALAANPDPFVTYQETFARLLPGKSLERIDPTAPRVLHYRSGASEPMAFNTLSSGEQAPFGHSD